MAVKYKGQTSIKRKDVFFVDYDAKKIIKKLEDAGKDTKKALERAALRALPLLEKEFKSFITEHHYSGETESALASPSEVTPEWGKVATKKWVGFEKQHGRKLKVINENDVMFLTYGFKLVEGLPALFLDIGVWEGGTPRQAPTFFIYYAIERNMATIHAMQKEELMKIVEELM